MRLGLSLLLIGCHTRFKRAGAELDAVKMSAYSTSSPDVNLGRVYSMDPGMGTSMTETWNLTQFSREVRFAAMLEEKVDPERMAAAFVYGVREQLGSGPPFAATDDAPDTLTVDVLNWGLSVVGLGSPAAFSYRVRVIGERADGSVFYRTTFRCYGNAGRARWLESVPWGRRFEPALDALPAAEVQDTFDKAAHNCGQQLAARMMRHGG